MPKTAWIITREDMTQLCGVVHSAFGVYIDNDIVLCSTESDRQDALKDIEQQLSEHIIDEFTSRVGRVIGRVMDHADHLLSHINVGITTERVDDE